MHYFHFLIAVVVYFRVVSSGNNDEETWQMPTECCKLNISPETDACVRGLHGRWQEAYKTRKEAKTPSPDMCSTTCFPNAKDVISPDGTANADEMKKILEPLLRADTKPNLDAVVQKCKTFIDGLSPEAVAKFSSRISKVADCNFKVEMAVACLNGATIMSCHSSDWQNGSKCNALRDHLNSKYN